MARIHLRISGRVQGVWYRGATQREAGRLGLVGWVRNLPDGCVEAEAQGEQRQLDALVRWCKRGPPAAHVTQVQVAVREILAEERGFEIVY